ncbi:hypothetical protein MOX02_22980 [Methylobacterium oxalidis]|uniref:Calcium-binding protein n=2 Tax=Methylobacterium oxalidis TaxID=944322 RepID=A0A512J2U5_9HYPH|nr:hypothetical protein [Methylobacterium oxalidis]GEP04260.1 hypothetical protein MOX02_22980 [Methylobacterium oxalidis]GJE35078.1 hypothetical protein LDDCCGHA_5296 [Methylobacterium oxalidis]GLS67221.1 hypothetical protein GCM10007888_56040 [Methylobacterium oxalidis]
MALFIDKAEASPEAFAAVLEALREGEVLKSKPGLYKVEFGDTVITLRGSGFEYDKNDHLIDGTLNAYRVTENDRVQFTARGLDNDISDLLDQRSPFEVLRMLSEGDDRIIANQHKDHNDVLRGFAGDDYIKAGPGDDNVRGNNGDDRLYLQDGNDKGFGGRGDDYIDSGRGNDVQTGGTGSDTFVFKHGYGKDIITDFQPGNAPVQPVSVDEEAAAGGDDEPENGNGMEGGETGNTPPPSADRDTVLLSKKDFATPEAAYAALKEFGGNVYLRIPDDHDDNHHFRRGRDNDDDDDGRGGRDDDDAHHNGGWHDWRGSHDVLIIKGVTIAQLSEDNFQIIG